MNFQVPCYATGAERYSRSDWGMHGKMCEHQPELWLLHAHDQFDDGACPAVFICDPCQLSILVVDLQDSASLFAARAESTVATVGYVSQEYAEKTGMQVGDKVRIVDAPLEGET